MWKSSSLATLFAPEKRWEGDVILVNQRPVLTYTRSGEQHAGKTYGIQLQDLVKCQTNRGWLWCTATLCLKNGREVSFYGLGPSTAKAFQAKLEQTAKDDLSTKLVRCEGDLDQLLARIRSFSTVDCEFPYAAIFDFAQLLALDSKSTLDDARAVVDHAYATCLAEECGRIRQLCETLSESLKALDQTAIADLSSRLTASTPALEALLNRVEMFKSQDHYLRHSEILRFTRELANDSEEPIEAAVSLTKHPYAKEVAALSQRVQQLYEAIRASASVSDESYEVRNKQFVISEKARGNTILAKLNDEQQTAAIVFDDRNLLVAAAGSGKSWTLIGKIGYALTRKLFKPSDVIALAFNAEAADELNHKINHELRPHLGVANVKAHTFHALGMGILRTKARQDGRRIKIFGSSRKGQYGEANRTATERKLLQQIVERLKGSDASFLSNWTMFRTLCRQPSPTQDAFATYQDYVDYVEEQRKERRSGEPALLQSLDGNVVRSLEELAICNWLWMNGVRYEYERDFTPKPPGWDKFNPDFYFPEIDTWHEHFGLDEYGRAPQFFKNPEWYAEQTKHKAAWFDQEANGRWFSTSSAEYKNGTIFAQMSEQLTSRGVTLSRRDSTEVEAQIKTLRQFDEISLLIRALHIVRGNGYSRTHLDEMTSRSVDPFRSQMFVSVLWPIQEAYANALKDRGEIDFDDMIMQAAEALEHGDVEVPYSLIMVDEFQDLSPGRARLVKALLKQRPDKSILFAVGDDWQAINGFAGSDLNLFMGFENTFGKAWEGPLSTTFRCSQGIADVSSWFVMENGYQKRKDVMASENPQTEAAVDLIDFFDDESATKGAMPEIERVVEDIVVAQPLSPSDAPGKKLSVYVLGRYKLENMACLDEDRLTRLAKKHESVLDLSYKTIHSSKGLEADYVFCVGLNRGKYYNFPSNFETDPLVTMLLAQNEGYPNAEERRLFYVAMTRAKRKVFLMFQRNKASSFTVELMNSRYRKRVLYRGDVKLPRRCKGCGEGYLLERDRKDGSGKLLGCSRYIGKERPDSCTYKENLL